MALQLMRRRRAHVAFISASIAMIAATGAARAALMVGGVTFADNNAFADQLVSSTGSYTTSGGSLESVLVGSNTADYAYSFDTGANVVMKFADNSLINGPGADLAVYELGVPDAFDLAISVGGTTHFYVTSPTGQSSGGFGLNVAEVNLDDFGLAAGAAINTIQVFEDSAEGEPTSITAFGAINSGPAIGTPEPVSGLAVMSFGGIMLVRRRSRPV